MLTPRFSRRNSLLTLCLAVALHAATLFALQSSPQNALADQIESARRTSNEYELQSLKTQLTAQVSSNPSDAQRLFLLAQVESYLVSVFEARKDKKLALATLEQGISHAQHSVQLNENSSEAHSLLADLYGRRIGFGGLFAGPRFGPKVKQENEKALVLDNKNPRVWASLGRQYLMAPAMFGGDINKAIESFRKSLALDPSQDETCIWLALAFKKKGDLAKARELLDRALELNPQSHFARHESDSLELPR
jgi:tetratricopeptide (TPR) repeat protein